MKAGWGNVKDLINRGIVVSRKGEEGSPEFANIVNDVQRIAVLYGEELFTTIPVKARKKTLELFGVCSEQNQKITKKEELEEDSRKAKKSSLRLIRSYYRKRTTKLVYEERSNHMYVFINHFFRRSLY